jgi:2-methylcitrate dehydratase PrpD
VLAGGFKTSVELAAFTNGVLAHALDYDDTWLPLGHPTCTVFPVILALGEMLDLPGRRLLEAFVLGLEVHGKVGMGYSTPGFHSTGIYGSLAAAAAASRLLGLDAPRTRMALGIAASHASGLHCNVGTMTKPYHAGNAASGGVRAALLARDGFTADGEAIEGRGGFADAFIGRGRYDPETMTRNLGNPFHILSPGIGIKKYPTCYINHRALDAILQLVRRFDIKPEEVEEVVVGVPHEDILNRPEPETGLRAKFSLQYNMAAALLDRGITIDTFREERVHAPDIRTMLKRVRLEVDPSIPSDYKDMYNPVTLRLRDGRVLTNRVDIPHGDWDDPLSLDEVVAKYEVNARLVLPEGECREVLRLMLDMDRLESVRGLMDIVTREPR